MTVDDAFKLMLTLGVIVPEWQPKRDGPADLAPQQPAP